MPTFSTGHFFLISPFAALCVTTLTAGHLHRTEVSHEGRGLTASISVNPSYWHERKAA